MARIRAIIRTITFIILTSSLYLLWLLGRPIAARSRLPYLKWQTFVLRTWARVIVRLIGVHITVKGQPPQPPFFMVSNHLSYVDMIAYLSKIDCLFIAKSSVANWPFIGPMSRNMGILFIDRKKLQDIPRVIDLIQHNLNEHRGIILFAEGTSSPGATVKPFFPSLLEPVARANFPVSYACLTYRSAPEYGPTHETICWWGGRSFTKHLFKLFHTPTFEATMTFGTHTIHEQDRKTLARKLHQAITDQFTPIVSAEEIESQQTTKPWTPTRKE